MRTMVALAVLVTTVTAAVYAAENQKSELAQARAKYEQAQARIDAVFEKNRQEALAAYAGKDIRLIYMSSFQVYQMPQRKEPVNEHHPLNPQNI